MPEQAINGTEPAQRIIISEAVLPALSVTGNDLQIFTEAQPLYASMLNDIERGQARIWLETYIFLADAAGRAFAEALKARARAGVDVRVMYDAIGSYSAPEEFFDDMRQAGVQVHAYHTIAEAFRRFAFMRVFNRRDHRKILVIDNHVGYFGGMNIVDQSKAGTVESAKAHHLPASAGWRDVHIRLQGPKLPAIASAFDRLWRSAKRPLLRLARFQRPGWPIREMLAEPGEGLYFFESRPGSPFRTPLRVFLPLVDRARKTITVSMAYFLPFARLLRALYRARRRGVAVRVIVPCRSDVGLVQRATRHIYGSLLKHGIEVFERQDQMLHSKVTAIDGEWTVTGSCNMDARSLRWNFEFFSVIRSRALADVMERICDFEISKSRRVTPSDYQQRRWWQRLLDRGAYLLRGWL